MSARIECAVAILLGLLVIVTSLPFWLSPDLREAGDLAANALQVERAREGHEWLGPYSQHGFHHPGPIAFYYQAWSEPLWSAFPSYLARHLAAQLALNLAALAAAVWLLGRAGLPPALRGAGVLLVPLPLIFLSGGNAMMLASVWGPAIVVAPMALCAAAMARVAAGDLKAAPLAAGGATVAWHTHVLTIVPLAVLGALTAVWLARTRPPLTPSPRSREGRRWGALTLAIGAGGIIPVVAQEVTHDPGNLTLMWRFLRSHGPQVHPWSEVARHLGEAFTDPLVVLCRPAAGALAGPGAALAVMAAVLVATVAPARHARRDWQVVTVFAWAALATAAVSARYVYGELHTYLFYYAYGMVGLLYLAMAKAIHERWLAHHLDSRPIRLGVVTLAALAGLGSWLAGHSLAPPAAPDDVATVMAALAPERLPAAHLALGSGPGDGDLWDRVPTFALQLRRAGTRVTVSERFVIVCGDEMRSRPDAPTTPTLLFTREPDVPGEAAHVRFADWGVALLPPPAR